MVNLTHEKMEMNKIESYLFIIFVSMEVYSIKFIFADIENTN